MATKLALFHKLVNSLTAILSDLKGQQFLHSSDGKKVSGEITTATIENQDTDKPLLVFRVKIEGTIVPKIFKFPLYKSTFTALNKNGCAFYFRNTDNIYVFVSTAK